MSMNQKEELRTQNMIRFIEAARELIDQEGLESLSIRKIAEKAGFHLDGILRQEDPHHNGDFLDVNTYSLLRSEWS